MNINFNTLVGELKMINPNGIFLMCESSTYSDSHSDNSTYSDSHSDNSTYSDSHSDNYCGCEHTYYADLHGYDTERYDDIIH